MSPEWCTILVLLFFVYFINSNIDSVDETMSFLYRFQGKALIPESIIPSEFHIKKHRGVTGLEIHEK